MLCEEVKLDRIDKFLHWRQPRRRDSPIGNMGGANEEQRVGRDWRQITGYARLGMKRVIGTLAIGIRPWKFRGAMEHARSFRAAWDVFNSHSGVLDGLPEEPWWRSRHVRASARASYALQRARYHSNRTMTMCIALGTALGIAAFSMLVSWSGVSAGKLLLVTLALLPVTAVPVFIIAALVATTAAPYFAGAIITYTLAIIVSAISEPPGGVVPLAPNEPATLPTALIAITMILLVGGILAVVSDILRVLITKRAWRRTAAEYTPVMLLMIAADLHKSMTGPHPQAIHDAAQQAVRICVVADYIETYTNMHDGHPLLQAAFRQRMSTLARHLRILALQLLMASSMHQPGVISDLRRIAMCLLLGLYGKLPNPDVEGEALLTSTGRQRDLRDRLRWATITTLPGAAVATVYLLHIPTPSEALSWITTFAIVWAVIRIIATLEPNYSATVQAARGLVEEARDITDKL